MATSKIKVRRYTHSAKWIISLSIFWLLLSGYLKPLLLGFGVASVVLVMFVFNRMQRVDNEPQEFGTWLQIIRYTPWLLGQILSSSLRVTKLVWGSASEVSPSLAKINVETVPEARRTLYANSITLTPGTLTLDVDGDEVTVHALEQTSIDELKKGYIASKITGIWGENK